jgi:hypothetical protein
VRKLTILFLLIISSVIHAKDTHRIVSMEVNGSFGLSNGHIDAENTMQRFFKPTSECLYTYAPFPGLGLDFYFGKYFAASSGIAYLKTGQTTPETSVYFEDSEYPHQLKSYAILHYLTVPLLLKGGIHSGRLSAFVRGGLTPCYLIAKDVRWVIDGRNVEVGALMPNVTIKHYDILCSIGLECGTHFGNNGIFITGDYNKGVTSIARGINGTASNSIISFGIKYSRLVIK